MSNMPERDQGNASLDTSLSDIAGDIFRPALGDTGETPKMSPTDTEILELPENWSEQAGAIAGEEVTKPQAKVTANAHEDREKEPEQRKRLVGIVMGSDSDWQVMEPAANALAELGISYETDVVSAHRMPEEMVKYGRAAHKRGLRVLIAGAGGAAHLPGMLAAVTPLPVIGVPVPLKYLEGMDSLLSIVQMPSGVPVATVGIGNARNAGLLAARILAIGDPEATAKILDFQHGLRETAIAKGSIVRQHSH